MLSDSKYQNSECTSLKCPFDFISTSSKVNSPCSRKSSINDISLTKGEQSNGYTSPKCDENFRSTYTSLSPQIQQSAGCNYLNEDKNQTVAVHYMRFFCTQNHMVSMEWVIIDNSGEGYTMVRSVDAEKVSNVKLVAIMKDYDDAMCSVNI